MASLRAPASPPSAAASAASSPLTTPPLTTPPLTTPPLTTSPTPQQTGRRILVNASALASASLWRIVTSFLLQLIIARQLGIVGLGQYTIALAYLNVSQVLTELGLPALLVRDLAQMPWLRRSYFRFALGLQLGASLLIWGGLLLLTTILPFSPASQRILWIVGASLPFYAITSVTQTLFQASERMELVMGIEVLINTLILLFSVAVIFLGGTTQHLAAVLVVTQLISAVLGLILLQRSGLFAALPQSPLPERWSIGRRAAPFYGLALADVLLQRTDIVLLSIIGGETITGIYGAAYNLVRVGLKLVQNFWAALYPTLSRLYRQAPPQYIRLCNFSLRYGLLCLLAAASIGTGITQDVLRLIYGTGYHEAAWVLEILLWSAPFYLIENYSQTLLMVEQRPFQGLRITGLHLIMLVTLMPLLIPLWAATGAAWAALGASGIGALVSFRLLQRWQMPQTIAHPWLMLMLVVASYLLSLWLPVGWLWRLGLGMVFYLGIAWWSGLIAQEDWLLVRRILRNPGEERAA
ncbi:MAG: oligosaccharide flippase family protein [Caldilineaceae bacterium]|nr:oligosaccharide flippase family protein [Caldilineaceae bacterium]